jgi:hypothetical protein
MNNDANEQQKHLTWAEGRPREFDFVGAQAQAVAYQGRWNDARERYRRIGDPLQIDITSQDQRRHLRST